MTHVLLKPQGKQLFEIQAQNSHPRLSIRRALYGRFCKWLIDASGRELRNAALTALLLFSLAFLCVAPELFGRLVLALARWHDYVFCKFLPAALLVLYHRPLRRLFRRLSVPRVRRGSNQHTYRGVPVDELASFLLEHGQFTRDDAMNRLRISQGKHAAIAEELETHQVLIRGENNARVLNTITRAELVRQLAENFPLQFHDGAWAEKKGSYELFLRDKERQEQKEKEVIERKERRVERLERKRDRLEGEISTFGSIMAGEGI